MRRIPRIFVVLILILFNTVPVYASGIADVTLFATPSTTGSIINFTITYVSDNRLDMAWGLTPPTTKIMIRGKYSAYPADISGNVTPTDGYLVYYGSGTSTSDTSMNFDETMATLYYKAWGQQADGTWETNTASGGMESAIMTLLGILGLVGILTWAAFRNRNVLVSLGASLIWIFLFAYTRTNPINGVTQGSFTDSLVIFICWGMAIAIPFYTIFASRNGNADDNVRGEGFNFKRFLNNGDIGSQPTEHHETVDEYEARLHRILNHNGNRKKR